MAKPKYEREGVRILKYNINPQEVVENFIIHEMIKMFPEGNESFYDQIRYHVRQYKNHYSEDRFWRLVAGFSESYMLKGYYRMFRGDSHDWVLAEVDLDQLYVKSLSNEINDILKSVNYHATSAGEILREMPAEERVRIIDPFDFKRDSHPVLVVENEQGQLELHDGNRRTVNAAIFEIPKITAYLGFRKENGKPAIREDVLADVIRVMEVADKVDRKLIQSVLNILQIYKENYSNGPKLVDTYIKDHVIRVLNENPEIKDRDKLKKMARSLIAKKVEDKKIPFEPASPEVHTNGNGNGRKEIKKVLFTNAQGLQPS